MNSLGAFAMGQAALLRGSKQMIFDWHKAAQLIKEKNVKEASAGLRSDWEYTGGSIFSDGQPVLESGTYLSSNWAVPELDLDGEVVECYLFENDNVNNWSSGTIWPESALEILNAK